MLCVLGDPKFLGKRPYCRKKVEALRTCSYLYTPLIGPSKAILAKFQFKKYWKNENIYFKKVLGMGKKKS